MGNEVAIAQQPAVPAFGLSDLERIATAIARGGLFGSKDPHAVLTLCMLAQAEGQHPAVVFRDYDLIQGKPAKKAEAMMRDFLNAGGKVIWNRLDDECCEAVFSHPQGGEATINWTLARAQKAQLGGKDNWKKWPRQMLRSRVVSEGVRTVCPNATSGLYVPEEVRDFDSAAPSDTPPTPEAKRARDLKPIDVTPEAEDHSGLLGDLELAAGQSAEALESAWGKIGKDARKALADELPRLKGMCPVPDEGPTDEPNPETNDAHPGAAKADALINLIGEQKSGLGVVTLLDESKDDIAAMLPADAERVQTTATERRAAIEAKAKEGVE